MKITSSDQKSTKLKKVDGLKSATEFGKTKSDLSDDKCKVY